MMVPTGRRVACALAIFACALPRATWAAPDAEKIYVDALSATNAIPLPGFVSFKQDITARNLHPICSPTEDGGEFSVDMGGRRNSSTYLLTYYASDRSGSVEDLRTHAHCTGPGLLAPAAASREAGSHAGMHLDHIVGETLRDERKDYAIALSGETVVDGARVWRLVLTPRAPTDAHGDDLAQKTILVDETTSRIREILFRVREMTWAGGASVDIDIHFDAVDRYWLVDRWSVDVHARALVVPFSFAYEARSYDYSFGERRQAVAPPAG